MSRGSCHLPCMQGQPFPVGSDRHHLCFDDGLIICQLYWWRSCCLEKLRHLYLVTKPVLIQAVLSSILYHSPMPLPNTEELIGRNDSRAICLAFSSSCTWHVPIPLPLQLFVPHRKCPQNRLQQGSLNWGLAVDLLLFLPFCNDPDAQPVKCSELHTSAAKLPWLTKIIEGKGVQNC